jgi:hypothetical protein
MNYSCCLIYYYCGPYARKFLRSETITPRGPEALLSTERIRPALSSQARAPTVCSEECRAAARWSRWKAQERYRTTPAGQEKRNDQSKTPVSPVGKGAQG